MAETLALPVCCQYIVRQLILFLVISLLELFRMHITVNEVTQWI